MSKPIDSRVPPGADRAYSPKVGSPEARAVASVKSEGWLHNMLSSIANSVSRLLPGRKAQVEPSLELEDIPPPSQSLRSLRHSLVRLDPGALKDRLMDPSDGALERLSGDPNQLVRVLCKLQGSDLGDVLIRRGALKTLVDSDVAPEILIKVLAGSINGDYAGLDSGDLKSVLMGPNSRVLEYLKGKPLHLAAVLFKLNPTDMNEVLVDLANGALTTLVGEVQNNNPGYLVAVLARLNSGNRRDMLANGNNGVLKALVDNSNPEHLVTVLAGSTSGVYTGLDSGDLKSVLMDPNGRVLEYLKGNPMHLAVVLYWLRDSDLKDMLMMPEVSGALVNNADLEYFAAVLRWLQGDDLKDVLTANYEALGTFAERASPALLATVLTRSVGGDYAGLNPKGLREVLVKKPEILNTLKKDPIHLANVLCWLRGNGLKDVLMDTANGVLKTLMDGEIPEGLAYVFSWVQDDTELQEVLRSPIDEYTVIGDRIKAIRDGLDGFPLSSGRERLSQILQRGKWES